MAFPATESAHLGHKPQLGLGTAYEEMMQADSRGVKVYFDNTTTWPPTTTVPEEVHEEIVLEGSCEQMEEIGSTTNRSGARRSTWRSGTKRISKSQGTCRCHHPTSWWSGGAQRQPPPVAINCHIG
ncbi:hypothetical protein CJ030_MR3G019157 [Morella rubra]|uniref:Uncharacterized protein n=1 Tax=Morella rubra TaxID=262757 RepID=A0A6A1W395_9ROSI|nr:hypothetical protein CJ030_MR3G019157 [Morella rubra]